MRAFPHRDGVYFLVPVPPPPIVRKILKKRDTISLVCFIYCDTKVLSGFGGAAISLFISARLGTGRNWHARTWAPQALRPAWYRSTCFVAGCCSPGSDIPCPASSARRRHQRQAAGKRPVSRDDRTCLEPRLARHWGEARGYLTCRFDRRAERLEPPVLSSVWSENPSRHSLRSLIPNRFAHRDSVRRGLPFVPRRCGPLPGRRLWCRLPARLTLHFPVLRCQVKRIVKDPAGRLEL